MVFGEDDEAVLPDGAEFVWYATRSKTKRGTWYSWKVDCVSAHGLRVLVRSLRAIWKDREFEVVWMSMESPDPPGTESCTGAAASWCPNCGNCSCPTTDTGERSLDLETCLLHGQDSRHDENRNKNA